MTDKQRQFGQRHTPLEIRVNRPNKTLDIDFDNGSNFSIAIELLRVESPSAAVQGHAPSQKTLVSGKRNITINSIQPIGNYAIQIGFDDGHDSGYFTWNLLYSFGEHQNEMWENYLENLEKARQSRD